MADIAENRAEQDVFAVSWLVNHTGRVQNLRARLSDAESTGLDRGLAEIAKRDRCVDDPLVVRVDQPDNMDVAGAQATGDYVRLELRENGFQDQDTASLRDLRDTPDARQRRAVTISWTFPQTGAVFAENFNLSPDEAEQIRDALQDIAEATGKLDHVIVRDARAAAAPGSPVGLDDTIEHCARALVDDGVDPDVIRDAFAAIASDPDHVLPEPSGPGGP